MWVFPGGRVDDADADPEAPEDEVATARRTAVREAAEEAGVVLPLESLVAYSHWTPPPITPRRFLTWFFMAPCPNAEIEIDGGEIHEHAWMTPSRALAQRDGGEIELAPPTWVTLWALSRYDSVQQAIESAQGIVPERFETRIAVEPAGPTAMWHGDAGWASGDAEAPGDRHRLCMHSGGWRYERTDRID